MFKQSCFIRKNNFQLRVALHNLGYENARNDTVGNCIATTTTTQHYNTISQYYVDSNDPRITWKENRIDCGTNEELFIAIASLRNDSDKNQWFICQEEYISTHTMELVKVGTWQMNTQYDKLTYGLKHLWRKASLQELIEHFTKK